MYESKYKCIIKIKIMWVGQLSSYDFIRFILLYFGLILGQHLGWFEHVDHVINKMSSNRYALLQVLIYPLKVWSYHRLHHFCRWAVNATCKIYNIETYYKPFTIRFAHVIQNIKKLYWCYRDVARKVCPVQWKGVQALPGWGGAGLVQQLRLWGP